MVSPLVESLFALIDPTLGSGRQSTSRPCELTFARFHSITGSSRVRLIVGDAGNTLAWPHPTSAGRLAPRLLGLSVEGQADNQVREKAHGQTDGVGSE